MRAGRLPRLVAVVFALALMGAACATDEDPAITDPDGVADAPYEIWAIDQGTGLVHIYDQDLREVDNIDLSDVVELPHMIDFTSDYEHAFIASPASGHTVWVRTTDREILHVIETGPGSHMAAVTPDDATVITASIGDGALVELLLDLEAETYEVGRVLVVGDDPMVAERSEEFPGASPVCHQFTDDGSYAYVTLGPALDEGGLVVVDVEAFELVAAYPPSEVRVNCGTILSPNGDKMYVNGGSVDAGVWYVFDTSTHEPTGEERPSGGLDTHGVWVTPDGSELWMVNRASSNGIVINPSTDEVIFELESVGRSPDIIAMSPDGRRAFITLRGPEPLTGPHAVAGDTPGFSVIDVASRALVEVVQPAEGDEASDFHGIGVRPLG
jgi:DNA-binding beta-propeller fold protein YncE